MERDAATEAREYARDWGRRHGLKPLVVEDIALIVTELVSNAVRHGDPPYSVDLSESNGVVRGEVGDASPVVPSINPSPDHCGGYGLTIVTACSRRWGTAARQAGKTVWFEVARS